MVRRENLRIVVNIPKNYKDTELIINIGEDEGLPFEDAFTNEEEVKELTKNEESQLNAFANYLAENMGGDVEILEEELDLDTDFGGDIEVG